MRSKLAWCQFVFLVCHQFLHFCSGLFLKMTISCFVAVSALNVLCMFVSLDLSLDNCLFFYFVTNFVRSWRSFDKKYGSLRHGKIYAFSGSHFFPISVCMVNFNCINQYSDVQRNTHSNIVLLHTCLWSHDITVVQKSL